MHRTDGTNHLLNLFASADPAAGRPTGTLVTAEWLNDNQENICRFIEAAGITLSKNNYGQLEAAINVFINAAINNLVNNAPINLDTLDDLAASIGDDDDFIGTMNSALGGKSNNGHGHLQSSITGLVAALASKSDDGHDHSESILTDVAFVGAVLPFPFSSAPLGFLKCNGAAISRTSYANLFAEIGTDFGAGNGSSTFNLPDFRGDVIRGWDDGRGVDSGRALGSLQLDSIQNITGSLRSGSRGSFGSSNSGAFSAPYGSSLHGNGTNLSSSSSVDFDASLVVRTSDETRARNSALTLCIKY